MGGKNAGKATTLEFYMEFLENPKDTDLTNRQLNQIISMHGFRKLHHSKKKELVETLSSIELLVPFRSTLKENITSAFLSPEKMIKDLTSLQWKEGSVQSVKTVGLKKKLKDSLSVGETGGKLLKKRKRNSTNKFDALAIVASCAVADTAMITPPAIESFVTMEELSGTFIMAMKFCDEIFACTDSKVVSKRLDQNDKWEEVVKYRDNGKFDSLVDGRVYLLFAGDACRRSSLMEKLEFAIDRFPSNKQHDIVDVANLAARILHEDDQDELLKDFQFEGLFCGFSPKENNSHKIYYLESRDENIRDIGVYHVGGSGGNELNYLDLNIPLEPTAIIGEDEARSFCLNAAQLAKSRDSKSCGGYSWILRINRFTVNGPERVEGSDRVEEERVGPSSTFSLG